MSLLTVKDVQQQRNENENFSLNPPSSLLARLSAKKANRSPLNTWLAPFTQTEKPLVPVCCNLEKKVVTLHQSHDFPV